MLVPTSGIVAELQALDLGESEAALMELAAVFFQNAGGDPETHPKTASANGNGESVDLEAPNPETMYRALVEQIPAVVFMAYLDRGIGEAYVSPRIEEAIGFTQAEWLEDPVRWYNQIHPGDKERWSIDAAQMLLTGQPLRASYRVLARDGRVIWFQCEAKMIRRDNGRPWFIHGVGFDITDLKETEQTLDQERNVVSGILNTVAALVVVLGTTGQIIRSNLACEKITGYSAKQMRGKYFWELFMSAEEGDRSKKIFDDLGTSNLRSDYESELVTAEGERRRVAWSNTVLPGEDAAEAWVIATGIDITERKRMEEAILDVSAREQRQIGQDLHDGLGQHLTGIAFMSKVLQQKLSSGSAKNEAADAAKIVRLVNEAINKTRELSRGLLPVVSDADGLMGALKRWAAEVEDLFNIQCDFVCVEPVLIPDVGTATHLFHIAQEAVNNALRHAGSQRIVIMVERQEGFANLTIEDDGAGIRGSNAARPGLGLRIMSYRANIIGGSLEVIPGIAGGTVVRCRFPLADMGAV
ncbi:MAG: PAS domain S-box protein [Gemmatimonadaceae bacterium]